MISQGNSHSIAQESSEIWADQVDLQPISFKSERLLVSQPINFTMFDVPRIADGFVAQIRR